MAAWVSMAQEAPFTVGYSKTLLGRKRYYSPVDPNLSADDRNAMIAGLRNQAKNSPIQGTSADITKLAMVMVADSYLSLGLPAHIVSTIHDEILVEAQKAIAEQAAKILRDKMREAGSYLIKTVPIEAVVQMGDCWVH